VPEFLLDPATNRFAAVKGLSGLLGLYKSNDRSWRKT
jgi:hypothetical protein